MFNLRGKYLVLMALVAIVAIGWSALWIGVRATVNDVIDTEIVNAKNRGLTIECPDRALGGWPFRLELSCSALILKDGIGSTAQLEGLRTVALAYNPGHVILEADGPAMLAGGAGLPTTEAEWTLARASTQLAVDGAEKVDVVLAGLNLSTKGPLGLVRLTVNEGELHLRENPVSLEDLDVAASFSGVASGMNTAALDGSLVGRIEGASALLKPSADFHPAGSVIHIDSLVLTKSDLHITASGRLEVADTGELSGDLPITINGVAGMATAIRPLFPDGSPVPDAIQGAVQAFGKPGGEPGSIEVPVRVDAGMLRIGLVPLGTVPPVF